MTLQTVPDYISILPPDARAQWESAFGAALKTTRKRSRANKAADATKKANGDPRVVAAAEGVVELLTPILGPTMAVVGTKREPPAQEKDMPKKHEGTPGEVAEQGAEVEEFFVDAPIRAFPFTATSLPELEAQQQAARMSRKVGRMAESIPMIVAEIMATQARPEQVVSLKQLGADFTAMVNEAFKDLTMNDLLGVPPAEDTEETSELSETTTFEIFEEHTADGGVGILIEPIQPGWGNQRDNNYYPAEALRRNAHKFVDVKLFQSEHEKHGDDNFVGTIGKLDGFAENGAPRFETFIHNAQLAGEIREMSNAGTLHLRELSIQGRGIMEAEAFTDDQGRKGKRLKEFTHIDNVDFVAHPGAGGLVVGLIEKDKESNEMTDKNKKPEAPVEEQEVPIREKDMEPVAETEPKALDAVIVKRLLAESNLPGAAMLELADRPYADEAAVEEAITGMASFISKVSGAGRPANMGGNTTGQPAEFERVDERERNAALDSAPGWGSN